VTVFEPVIPAQNQRAVPTCQALPGKLEARMIHDMGMGPLRYCACDVFEAREWDANRFGTLDT
jgi:hypothetical protein